MKHIGLTVFLLATVLLAACGEKEPYQPPVPRTEPDKAKGVGNTDDTTRARTSVS